MSWDAYANRGQEGCPASAKFVASGVFGIDGAKWATAGADYGAFGPWIVKADSASCKNNFLGQDNNMMQLGPPGLEGVTLYKKAGHAAAIGKSSKAVAFVLVEGTPQDALQACKAIKDALAAVNF